MNLDEIKEIIQNDKGKFIIVENGRPIIVILSFEDYKKILKLSPETRKPEEVVPIRKSEENFVSAPLHGESIEESAGAVAEEREEEIPETSEIPSELEEEPLKIEDLPF